MRLGMIYTYIIKLACLYVCFIERANLSSKIIGSISKIFYY